MQSHVMPQAGLVFDLQFERTDEGYIVQLIDSPVGPVTESFLPPLTRGEINAFWQHFTPSSSGLHRTFEAMLQEAKGVGLLLFAALLPAGLETAWRMSREQAMARQSNLRVRLDFANVPELATLPWEMLFDPTRNEFLALASNVALTRFMRLRHHISPEPPPTPLRALVVLPRPSSFPSVDADRNWIEFLDTIDYLGADGKLVVERLTRPTLHDLQRKLRQGVYHIFHFMGHAVFDKHSADGQLVFEDEMGRSRLVSGEHLGGLLRDHHTLRLVCISGPEGVVFQPERSPYLAAAEQLLRKGMAAVIAPRYATPPAAQLAFYHRLYAALTMLTPVDLAVNDARQAMDQEMGGAAWAAPILFSRVGNGVLFGDDRVAVENLPAHVQESIQYRLNSLRIRTATLDNMKRWGDDIPETRRRRDS
ncbi:MAG: CHAT domain-containing protein [Litorilinea sp.]